MKVLVMSSRFMLKRQLVKRAKPLLQRSDRPATPLMLPAIMLVTTLQHLPQAAARLQDC
jgi:hypothetical protein